MDKPHCVINPKTNRAVKADSKLGKQILAGNVKKEPHTMYKKPIGPVKPKVANTQYKKPIGPKVEDIPRILRKRGYNKTTDFKGEIVDDPIWRKKLPTKEEIERFDTEDLVHNLRDLLGDIDIYLKLNVKLDRDDEANFKALHPTIELILNRINKYKINLKNHIYLSEQYENYKRKYRKYMKLRKIITGQEIEEIKEPDEFDKMYKTASVVKPNRDTLSKYKILTSSNKRRR